MFSVHALARPADDGLQAHAFSRSDLSSDQVKVFDAVFSWCKDPNASLYLTVGGLAGTGKTTLVSALARYLQGNVFLAHAAFTGKATNVLSRKLRAQGLETWCGTLHSLLYIPIEDPKTGRVVEWVRKPRLAPGDGDAFDLIIIDEASMISRSLWTDLISYDIPVIAVGDHGQLPPVGSDMMSLMTEPHLRLEKIHRQAADNPIIQLAHFVREGGTPASFRSPDARVSIVRTFPLIADELAKSPWDTAAICYFNKTRNVLNDIVRRKRGFDGPHPDPGDVVVCLRNYERILFNGMRGIFRDAEDEVDKYGRFKATVEFPDDYFAVKGRINLYQFGRAKRFEGYDEVPGNPTSWWQVGMLFDYGYAITCHKSQGSQWRKVFIRHERFPKDDEDTQRRWIYTAVTRAEKEVVIIP